MINKGIPIISMEIKGHNCTLDTNFFRFLMWKTENCVVNIATNFNYFRS